MHSLKRQADSCLDVSPCQKLKIETSPFLIFVTKNRAFDSFFSKEIFRLSDLALLRMCCKTLYNLIPKSKTITEENRIENLLSLEDDRSSKNLTKSLFYRCCSENEWTRAFWVLEHIIKPTYKNNPSAWKLVNKHYFGQIAANEEESKLQSRIAYQLLLLESKSELNSKWSPVLIGIGFHHNKVRADSMFDLTNRHNKLAFIKGIVKSGNVPYLKEYIADLEKHKELSDIRSFIPMLLLLHGCKYPEMIQYLVGDFGSDLGLAYNYLDMVCQTPAFKILLDYFDSKITGSYSDVENTTQSFIQHGDVSLMLVHFKRTNQDLSDPKKVEEMLVIACSWGCLEILKWFRANVSIGWNGDVALNIFANISAKWDIVKWLHSEGLLQKRMDIPDCVSRIVMNGDIIMLDWINDNYLIGDQNVGNMKEFSKNFGYFVQCGIDYNQIGALKWLEEKYPLYFEEERHRQLTHIGDEVEFYSAIKQGRLILAKWFNPSLIWNSNAIKLCNELAKKNNKLPILQWLFKNKSPYNMDQIIASCKHKAQEVLAWLITTPQFIDSKIEISTF